MFRRITANLLLLVLGFASALLLGEALVRRVAPQQRALSASLRGLHRSDPELGYVMVPGFARRVHTGELVSDVRTNSLGLRDREPAPVAPGTRRILGIGDSFAFGIHAGAPENCFLEQLESRLARELAARPHRGADGRVCGALDVVNAGVEGYGTEQEIGLLRRLDPVLHPDAVLLAFYLGNDFTDNSGRTRMTVADGYQMLEASAAGYREHFRPLHRRVRLWLHARSELYLLLKRGLVHPARRTLPAAPQERAAPQSFDYFVYDSGFANSLRADVAPDLARGVEATRRAFAALRRWCEDSHAAALVVVIPAQQQVDLEARRRWIERFGLQEEEFDFGLPNRRLAGLAAEAGLPLFDLTEAFAAHTARGETLHLKSDTHWNAAGHALAAQLLVQPVLEYLVDRAPGTVIGAR